MNDGNLDRLFRASAAANAENTADEMPFGFDTRVVALWRSQQSLGNNLRVLGALIRRAVAVAIVLIVAATAGIYWEWNCDTSDTFTNAYSIGDNAIDAGVTQ